MNLIMEQIKPYIFHGYNLVLTSNLCCPTQGMKGVRCVGLVDGSETDQTERTDVLYTSSLAGGGWEVGDKWR